MTSNRDHNGLVADDGNRIQDAAFRAQLREEAEFILEEQEDGSYKFTKPTDCSVTSVRNAFDFVRETNGYPVLIERLNGTYERYNFRSDDSE